MNKKQLLYATVAAASISMVAVSPTFANSIDEQQKISGDSGVIVNPAYKNMMLLEVNSISATNTTLLEASSIQQLTTVVEQELSKQRTTISVRYTGDTSNLKAQLKDVFDNYLYVNDYFRGIFSSWQFSYNGYVNDVTITMNLTYHTTPVQEAFIQSEVERIVGDIITPSMSDVEKVKAINDYIVLNTTYSKDTTTTPHAAYAILISESGV